MKILSCCMCRWALSRGLRNRPKVAAIGPRPQRCIALADALWLTPDAALLNALNVSYLEDLNFTGPQGDIAWGHMTPSLRIAWQQMQAYMRGLKGR